MDYIPPIGGAPGDPYVDANLAAGIEGSLVPAAAVELPQREIVNVIAGAGLAPDPGTHTQLLQAIQIMLSQSRQAVVLPSDSFGAGVVDGDIVRWDGSAGAYVPAVADGTLNAHTVGVADVTHGQVYLAGACPLFVGLLPGARYYLSPTTPGAITSTSPSTGAVKIGDALTETAMILDVDDVSTSSSLPVGTIFYVAGNVAPASSLALNGSLISRSAYPQLWAYAQASGLLAASDAAWTAGLFSPGDGATTFRVPDLRGEFIRGWDAGRGVDAGRAVGSSQAGALESHGHGAWVLNNTSQSVATLGGYNVAGSVGIVGSISTPQSYRDYDSPGNRIIGLTGAAETRPRNIAYLACIRYK